MLIGPNFKRLRKQTRMEKLTSDNFKLQKLCAELLKQNKELTQRLQLLGVNTNETGETAERPLLPGVYSDVEINVAADEESRDRVSEGIGERKEAERVEGEV